MRSVVALLLTASMTVGCFPHDPHKRTLAQFAEGGAVVGGIALEAFVSTGADCDMMTKIGAPPDPNCHSKSATLGGVGVALILAGLLGFVATISTAEEAKEPPKVDIKAVPTVATPTTDAKLPPQTLKQATPPAAAAEATPPAEPPTPSASSTDGSTH
jgi:hypothetical protein